MKILRHMIRTEKIHVPRPFRLSGPVIKVACRNDDPSMLHFWSLSGAGSVFDAQFIVFGTGDEIPDNVVYRGTGIAGPAVWHLFELVS
jgi:hypothetical protein